MDGRDLRKHIDSDEIADAFAKLVSGGKAGYKTVIEKDKPPIVCKSCTLILTGEEKFCPNCGTKIEKQQ